MRIIKKNSSQISNTLLWRLNNLNYDLTTYRQALLFARSLTLRYDSIIWENFSESYQSLYSSVIADSVIYSELSSCILKYLKIDFVWKCHHSVSHSQTLDESLKASTLWDIKNVKQLQHWIKQDSKVFLEDLNSLWTQRDLDVKACELFDKISSEQI